MIRRKAGSGLYTQNPLLATSNIFLPKSWRDAVRQCTYFYIWDEDINSAINKLSEYPLTKPEALNDSSTNSKKVLEILDDMDIMENVKKMNIEFFSRGNSIITFYKKFTRKLVCPHCKKEHSFKNVSFTNTDCRFEGRCPSCRTPNITFTIKDYDLKNETPSLVFLDIINFKIVANHFTGSNLYYYDIPKKEKKFLKKTQDKDFLATVPKVYFDAITSNKLIKFNGDKIFHAMHNTITGNTMFDQIGIPLIFPVLRMLFMKSLMRKADEQIASERILGMEYVAPEIGTKEGAGVLQVPFNVFKDQVQQALQNFKKNPNDMPIFPIGIKYGRIGGEGKMFLTLAEQQLISEKIINGLQLPYEFLKGGLSWSASSVTLRMLENKFLNLRQMNLRFINEFVIPKVVALNGLEPCKVKLADFKLQDDIQMRQLEEQLLDKEILSPSTFCERYGYDYEKEQKQWVIDSRVRKSAALSIAKNRALQNKVMVEEEVKSQIRANKMKSQLNLENEDGSYTIKRVDLEPGMIKQWKDMGFPMGELIKAQDAELARAQKEMELQLQMQAAANQTEAGGEEQGSMEEMIPQVQEYILAMTDQGASPDGIIAELQGQGIPDEVIQTAFASINGEEEAPVELTEEQYNFILEQTVAMMANSAGDISGFLLQNGVPEDVVPKVIEQAELIKGNIEQMISEGVPTDKIHFMFQEQGISGNIVETILSSIEEGFGLLDDEYLIQNFWELVTGKDDTAYESFFQEIKEKLTPEQLQIIVSKIDVFNTVYNLVKQGVEGEDLLIKLEEYGVVPDDFVEKSIYFIMNQDVKTPDIRSFQPTNAAEQPNKEIRPLPEQRAPRREGV